MKVNKKIKILFSISNLISSGSGREMINIIDGLDKDKFSVLVQIRKSGSDKEKELKEKGVEIITELQAASSVKGVFNSFKRAVTLGLNYRKYKIDIWQSFDWSSDWTEALTAKVSGAAYIYVKKNMNWDRKAWKLKSLLSSKVVLRNSDLKKSHFDNILFRGKGFFITGGVDTDKFKPINNVNNIYRQKFGIHNNSCLIICVAQISSVKGQHLIIEALKDMENAYLIIAGKIINPDYYQKVLSLIKKYDLEEKVIIPGFVEDIKQLHSESDIYILPTTFAYGHEEGCPVSLLEALSCGSCCIASDVAGSRDLISDGYDGYLFEPESVLDLKRKIELVKKASTEEIKKNARNNILKYHTLKHEQDEFQKLYLNLTN